MDFNVKRKDQMTDGELIRELCQIIQKLTAKLEDSEEKIRSLQREVDARNETLNKIKIFYADTDSVAVMSNKRHPDIRDIIKAF